MLPTTEFQMASQQEKLPEIVLGITRAVLMDPSGQGLNSELGSPRAKTGTPREPKTVTDKAALPFQNRMWQPMALCLFLHTQKFTRVPRPMLHSRLAIPSRAAPGSPGHALIPCALTLGGHEAGKARDSMCGQTHLSRSSKI